MAIIQSLYKSSKSCIKLNGMTGDWFDVVTGVRQGCILSPLLFAIVMDWIMKKSLGNFKGGLEWTGGSRLWDLDYADDIALIETSQTGMQQLTHEIERPLGSIGLCMNAKKCKIMVSNDWEDDTAVIAEGAEVELVERLLLPGQQHIEIRKL